MKVVGLEDVVVGQYRAKGTKPGYLDDATVPPGSLTPTFAAVAMFSEPFVCVLGVGCGGDGSGWGGGAARAAGCGGGGGVAGGVAREEGRGGGGLGGPVGGGGRRRASMSL